MKICFLSAGLGSLDRNLQDHHIAQDLPDGWSLDFHYFDDRQLPLRPLAMTSRLRAKLPKMLGFELKPGYDLYIWSDATITLAAADSIPRLVAELGDRDMLFFTHQDGRQSIREELAFMEQHMTSADEGDFAKHYLNRRYAGEPMRQQVEHYLNTPGFVDDRLYSGGLFLYRPTRRVTSALHSWLEECVRWSVQDQLSLTHVLHKWDVLVKALDYISKNAILNYHWRNEDNTHRWDDLYRNLPGQPSAFIYGDTATYELGAKFLADCETVQDWGCGAGGFKRFRPDSIGVDGSITPHATFQASLALHDQTSDGIFMRHVLEHNHNWRDILTNAIRRARKKVCVVLFTPMVEGETQELELATQQNFAAGVLVPTLSLSHRALIDTILAAGPEFSDFRMEQVKSDTAFGIEIIIRITLIQTNTNHDPLPVHADAQLEVSC